MYLTNIAAMKALGSIPATNEDITVGGYYSENDGGGGSFVWKSGSRPTQDNGYVIYHNSNTSGWFQRVAHNNVINVRWFGAKGDGVVNDYPVFSTIFGLIGSDESGSIFVPKGDYRMATSLEFGEKTIHMFGETRAENISSLQTSKLIFDTGLDGLKLSYLNPDTGESVIENLFIQSAGHSVSGSEVGITINQKSYWRNVTVYGFKGDGIVIEGALPSTHTNLAAFERVKSAFNGGNGFYIVGADANQMTFITCDAVENDGWGFYDESFLGNQYFACHCNGNELGSYKVVDDSARSTFVGCYSEEYGNRKSEITQYCNVLGGLHGNEVDGDGNRFFGNYNTGIDFYNAAGNYVENIAIRSAEMALKGLGSAFYLRPLNTEPGEDTNIAFTGGYDVTQFVLTYANLDSDKDIWQIIGREGIPYLPGGNSYPRRLNFASQMFRNFFLQNTYVGTVSGIADTQSGGPELAFLKGDLVLNSGYTGYNPMGWMCMKNGTAGSLGAGVTGTKSSANVITLNAANTTLKEGYTITWNSTTRTITAINSAHTQITVDGSSLPAGTNQPVSFSAPQFRAFGSGVGTTAQKPTLTANDAGYHYYDTTTSAKLLWTGSAWV
jgi:hypothetical protein